MEPILSIRGFTASFFISGDQLFRVFSLPSESFDTKQLSELDEVLTNDKFATFIGKLQTPVRIVRITNPSPLDLPKVIKFVDESYEMYKETVLPHIPKQNLKWIENIIGGTAEADKVIYQDDTCILLPDMNWDGVSMEQLDCLLLVKNRKLRSIRDLRSEDLSLLNKIRKTALTQISAKYGVEPDSLRLYFHYHPSFWWLHLHITHSAVSYGINVDRAHLIDTVIQHITMIPDYYQKIVLRIVEHNWSYLSKDQ